MSKLVEPFRQTGGAVLFKGNLNESGEVKIDNQQTLVTEGTNFSQSASLQVGTNVVSIVATDDNNNVKTNLYQIAISPGEEETFEYDLNGNLISRSSVNSVAKYDWDGANRLIRVIRHGGSSTNTTEFTYDGYSRRVRIVEKENDIITKDNRFVWEETSLVEERNSTGFLTTKRYYGQGVQIGNQNYYYTQDHLGSIREMTDVSGKVRARYDYDPYGRKIKLEGDLDADFGYTGHYHHAPSGLSLALYRAYDPELGRFINRDPIKEAGGFNLYGYVENDPVNYIDPFGLKPKGLPCPGGTYGTAAFPYGGGGTYRGPKAPKPSRASRVKETGRTQQTTEVKQAQQKAREQGRGESIHSTKRSEQEEKAAWKRGEYD